MRKLTILAAGVALLAGSCPSYAADHLFTATAAGGLTLSSQPFINGTTGTNNAPLADDVPGQGSPLSGNEHTVPASDTPTITARPMPPAVSGKTAPSANASVP